MAKTIKVQQIGSPIRRPAEQRATLKGLNRDRKVTIIMITHDIGTIGLHASKLLYLDKSLIFFGGFDDFCLSTDMTDYFGEHSQHMICHRHDT